MKNIKYILIIILMFVLKINVNATNLGISISCPKTAYSGDNISCSVNANASDGSINGINANYILENATLSSFNIAGGWSAYNNSANGFAIGNINGISGSNNIGTINIHVDGSAGSTVKVGLTGIGASDTDYNDVSSPNTAASISVIEKPIPTTTTRKKIVTLTNLSIDGYDIGFSRNKLEYTLDVDYEVTKLIVKAESDGKNKVSGLGEVNINEGENTILVKVTNPEGETTTYTIKVNRVVKVSDIVSNNIDEINNAFKSNKELTVNLNSETDNLVISAPVIDTIKNTDRKITYNIKEKEEVLYYYTFDGKKFTESYNDINLKIDFIKEDKVVEEKIKDEKKIEFENVHKSYFPTGTKLSIKNTTNIPSNKVTRLYKLNRENNLELISNKVERTENKYLTFEIEKGAKYVLSNDKVNSGKSNLLFIVISIIIFIEIIIVGLLLLKKIKSNKIEEHIEMTELKKDM